MELKKNNITTASRQAGGTKRPRVPIVSMSNTHGPNHRNQAQFKVLFVTPKSSLKFVFLAYINGTRRQQHLPYKQSWRVWRCNKTVPGAQDERPNDGNKGVPIRPEWLGKARATSRRGRAATAACPRDPACSADTSDRPASHRPAPTCPRTGPRSNQTESLHYGGRRQQGPGKPSFWQVTSCALCQYIQ